MNRRLLALVVCAFAFPACAQEEHHPGSESELVVHRENHDTQREEESHDTPEVIIHHVSDSLEYEFEIPWPGVDHNPTLDLGKIFAPLRFERTPGACDLPAPKAFDAAPSLGQWFQNGCYDLRPTKSILMMWIAAALLLIFVLGYSHRDSSKLVPKGVAANVIEVLVLFVRDEIAVKNIGKHEAPRYTTYLTTLFFFILTMNWLGLIPNFGSATGNLAVTVALASCTFVLTQIAAIRSAGFGGYLAHLTGGTPMWLWPIMIPVEILGLFTKPFALTVRLFANMLAGHMVLFFLLGLIFMLHPALAVVSVPMATAIYFLEIFVGLVQAYIFTLLSALFIGMAVAMGHHGGPEEAHTEPIALAH
jgi:F-type H+-transporting ATPase subunit a